MIDWLCDKYYNATAGLRNCWRYLPLIWHDRDCDFAYLLRLMEEKLRRMSVAIGDEGHLLLARQKGRELRVCAELCRRIREDDYYENASGPLEYKHWTTPTEHGTYELQIETSKLGERVPNRDIANWSLMAVRNRRNDVDYLCLMMRKHLLSWWD
jgi:hypothetical protein